MELQFHPRGKGAVGREVAGRIICLLVVNNIAENQLLAVCCQNRVTTFSNPIPEIGNISHAPFVAIQFFKFPLPGRI